MNNAWTERVAEQQTEIERLCELLWGSRCVFCGEVVGKEKKNQDIADEVSRTLAVARAHIKELEHSLEENGSDFPRAACESEEASHE